MSNPPLTTLKRKFDSLTAVGDLPADVTDETSEASCTKRIKLSARDLLASLSRKRISSRKLKFIGESSRDGGACGDVVVATYVKKGGREKQGRVAVKKLRFVINGDMTEEKFLRLFVNELRVLDKLSHPNIVEIIGFVEDVNKRIAWLVFPWEDNGNLREFLRSGEWEIPERVSLILDVATGIEYLHTSQPPICHGDLKSVSLGNTPFLEYILRSNITQLNILVNSSNRAVITDFGSARVIRRTQEASATPATRPAASTSNKGPECNSLPPLTITTSDTTLTLTGPACSLRWSPPEVLKGESLDLATDIWGLGWIAWEATTDRHPFEELKGDFDITMKIVEGQLPLIRDHTQLSQIYPLCNMMQKCWKPEPKERPSATECRRSLGLMPWAIPVVKMGEESQTRSAAILLQVGEMHRLQGRCEEASEAYTQGLNIARLAGDQTTVGNILVNLAKNDHAQSKYVEAEASYTQALAIYESIGNDWGRGNALRGLGGVQRKRSKRIGHIQRAWSKDVEAEASYTQALAIYESIGDDLGRANALHRLGNIQRARSKDAEAEASYTQALAICESIGDGLGRANVLLGLGEVQRARSKYVEAEASYTQALAIYESIGSDLGRANCSMVLGQIRLSQARYAEARTLINDASMVSEQIGYRWGKRFSKQILEEVVEAVKLSTEPPFMP